MEGYSPVRILLMEAAMLHRYRKDKASLSKRKTRFLALNLRNLAPNLPICCRNPGSSSFKVWIGGFASQNQAGLPISCGAFRYLASSDQGNSHQSLGDGRLETKYRSDQNLHAST